MKWPFPLGTAINANDHLIIWADNDIEQSGLHTNFKLSSLGDNIIFSNGAVIFDQIALGPQATDVSYARCPDGGATFMTGIPTFNATNSCLSGLNESFMNKVRIYPVPFNSDFTLNGEDILGKDIIIVDLIGREVYNGKIDSNNLYISGSLWISGVYSLRILDANGLYFEGKIVKI
jgi:hypothetical protein